MTMKLEVFDPAMCCSTGVCGPSVDPDLTRFAADLDWVGSQGVEVARYNLAQQPQAFVDNPQAGQVLEQRGEQGLPLILLDGRPVSSGDYPSRDTLALWAGVPMAPLTMVSSEQSSGGCCSPSDSGSGSGCC